MQKFFQVHEKDYQIFLWLQDGSNQETKEIVIDSWAYGIIGYYIRIYFYISVAPLSQMPEVF